MVRASGAFCHSGQRRAKFTNTQAWSCARVLVALSMNLSTRFLITAGFVCHLLLAPRLVTSQLLASADPQAAARSQSPSSTASNCPLGKDQDGVCAIEQEKDGAVFKLRGQV